jgi:hypothetical protein
MEEGERRDVPRSEELTGYRVQAVRRGPFTLVGYTRIYRPGEEPGPPAFWDEVLADGRLAGLVGASPVPPWVFGLGSWDPACPKGGHRHTISIEETPDLDPARLAALEPLFRKEIGASDWLCFAMPRAAYPERFWQDDPYRMLKALGYRFHTGKGDFSVGLHLDAFPPGCDVATGPAMEFWITVLAP